MNVSILAIMALTAAQQQYVDEARNDPFCKDLFAVYDQRADKFAALRGAYDTDRESWVALVEMPNASGCDIKEGYKASYSCTWGMMDDAPDVVARRALDIVNLSGWCFETGRGMPVSWNIDKTRNGSQLLSAKALFFREGLAVSVYAGTSRRGKPYVSYKMELMR